MSRSSMSYFQLCGYYHDQSKEATARSCSLANKNDNLKLENCLDSVTEHPMLLTEDHRSAIDVILN